MTWRCAPAGFVSGPRMLKMVRTPSSRRTGAACFIAEWCARANSEPGAHPSAQPPAWLGLGVDVRPQRLEHIRAPGWRGPRRVAVLGGAPPRRGAHEHRGRGDVESVRPVAAGPDDVDQVLG